MRYTFSIGEGALYTAYAYSETEARLRLQIDFGLTDLPLVSVEGEEVEA